MAFSADEGADVGEDGETPVVENYGIPAPYKFTGKIGKVTINVRDIGKAEKEEAEKSYEELKLKESLSVD
jgi:hypothetical protein